MRDPILWWNDYDELNCEYEVAVEIVRAIQRDAIEAAAKVADSDDAGGKGGGFDLLRHRIARRIRALLPPAVSEITAEKPEGT